MKISEPTTPYMYNSSMVHSFFSVHFLVCFYGKGAKEIILSIGHLYLENMHLVKVKAIIGFML